MTLPDDDGTNEAEVARFKRKRRLRLVGLAVLMVVVTAVVVVFVTRQFPADTTEAEELATLQRCNMNSMTSHSDVRGQLRARSSLTGVCNRVMLKLLRRLFKQPALCDRIAKQIAGEKDWERRNRLLHVLMRYRRAKYPDDEAPTHRELQRQPCVEEPVVQMAQQWNRGRDRAYNPGGLIPGVAAYNLRFLRHMRFLVTNTYVLKRVQLPRPKARRLAAHLLGQYRSLNRGATIDVQPFIKKVFEEVFYPLWAALGKPEPKQ